jgi:hypothetical protein
MKYYKIKKSIKGGAFDFSNIKGFKQKANSGIASLKLFQIKEIIEQYNKTNPDNAIKPYKSKTKGYLVQEMIDKKINPKNYKYEQENPKKPVITNVLKKYNSKQYGEEQKEYIKNLNKNEKYKNPLHPLEKYTTKEGTLEYIQLQEHQIKFIKQFVYSNLRGSIAFHGVGSGKTLTAVVCSHLYLKMYPENNVIVVSPSALLFNFINGMIQYGMDIKDNRYSYYTYEKYIRNPKIAKNALLIVDEAHNFRTPILEKEITDAETGEILSTEIKTNKKGHSFMKFGTTPAHKVLLLTGTAFVNKLYDIENLMAMIDARKPLSIQDYYEMMSNVSNIPDYFNYKISYYTISPKSVFFPERRDFLEGIYMDQDFLKKYKDIEYSDKILIGYAQEHFKDRKPNVNGHYGLKAYYNGVLNASNSIDGINNPKIEHIADLIKNKSQKFIVYSTLYEAGIEILMKRLDKDRIKYKLITGRQSSSQKEESKKYFNFYNFGKKDFFDLNTIDRNDQKYINDEYRVLLISKAGAEGVDTINCQNIILLDSQWNDALSEQIIARAIRYKSHFGLPEKERYVNVIRMLLLKPTDKPTFEKITSGNFEDWNFIKKEFDNEKNPVKVQSKKAKEFNMPTNWYNEYKDLKKKRSQGIGRKSLPPVPIPPLKNVENLPNFNIENYKKFNEEQKELYRYRTLKNFENSKNLLNKNFVSDVTNDFINGPSIDLYLLILAKAKTKNIDEFISMLGNNISLFEEYQSKMINYIMKKEKELKRKITEEEQALIYAKYFKVQEQIILNKEFIPKTEETAKKRSTQDKLQQFFTSEKLAEELINNSSIKKNFGKINVLEPTTGWGNLIKPLLKMSKDITIDMIEYDSSNRKVLEDLIKDAPSILRLFDEKDFLKSTPSTKYDYIFMNPPFHLRKGEIPYLIRDTYDYQFVMRAYACLKIGGELIAITGHSWKQSKPFIQWANSKNFNHYDKTNEKFYYNGKVAKPPITIMKFKKLNYDDDNKIFGIEFYSNIASKAKELQLNEIELKSTPKSTYKIYPRRGKRTK